MPVMPGLPPKYSAGFTVVCGIVFTAVLACISFFLAQMPFFAKAGFGSLTLAIIIGMLVGNTFFARLALSTGRGVDFAKNRFLRLGIILYGFGITLQEIGAVGGRGIIIDIIMVSAVFFFGLLLGPKLFGLDKESSILISTGSAICGVAAIMAVEPVLKTPPPKVSLAVAATVVFGTISLFLYPLLYPYLGFDSRQFGIYIGSTVHEVAQVAAAGKAVSEETAANAIIVKMIRVMLLVPFLLLLSAWQARWRARKTAKAGLTAGANEGNRGKILIPWFALFFVLASVIASLHIMPAALLRFLQITGTLLLTMAMAALGLRTHYSSIRQAGTRPLALAFALFLFLLIGGGFINFIILKL
ncbi:MAG: YeiH family protein [Candidatus Tokpelaia sp.]|nr:MAG: YeiH family protein [Candidatus Tokpelaia sp.]KAA6207689.1 MAG: YeiH family protein [Candidatus Tokpelaia sp.]